jgi:hypothetical protein
MNCGARRCWHGYSLGRMPAQQCICSQCSKQLVPIAVSASDAPHPVGFSLMLPQAFQVSDQCVKLVREGWFQPQAEPSGVSTMRNPKVGWRHYVYLLPRQCARHASGMGTFPAELQATTCRRVLCWGWCDVK